MKNINILHNGIGMAMGRPVNLQISNIGHNFNIVHL